jgi:hypothetical protein
MHEREYLDCPSRMLCSSYKDASFAAHGIVQPTTATTTTKANRKLMAAATSLMRSFPRVQVDRTELRSLGLQPGLERIEGLGGDLGGGVHECKVQRGD